VATSVGVEVFPINVRDAAEIERAVTEFGRSSNGGLIVTASALARRHRHLIIALASRHRLPAVYFARYFATAGGLISYGPIWSTSTGALRTTSTHPQGREAERTSRAVSSQISTGDQSQDRQGARPRRAAFVARPADEVIE
jgi:hypothetical protein